MVTGSGGQDVATAPKAAGLVALIRSVSDCGVSGTMTETPVATGSAAQRWWRTSTSHAAWTSCRHRRSSAGG